MYPSHRPHPALNFSVAPALASDATITAHVIPSLNFGVEAIGGLAKADLFVEFDASSTVKTSLDASATVSGSNSSPGVAVTSKSLDGCVDIGAGLAINAGADLDGQLSQLFEDLQFVPNVSIKAEGE
jgi:hypothetical protein